MIEFLTRAEQKKMLIEYEVDYGSTIISYNKDIFNGRICAIKIHKMAREIHSTINRIKFDEDILDCLLELAESMTQQVTHVRAEAS